MPHRIALAKSTICWMFGSGTFGLTVAAIDPATAGSIVTAILFAVCGAVIHWGGKLIELKKAIRISRAQTDGEIAIIYAKTRAAVDVIEAKGGGAKVAEKLDRNFAATQSLVDNLPSKDDLVDGRAQVGAEPGDRHHRRARVCRADPQRRAQQSSRACGWKTTPRA